MRTAFIDVDTQIDFLFPAGALYVPGAERLISNMAKLNRYAVEHGIPLVSTADSHAEDDPEFLKWPAHCVAGTVGQQKPQATLMSSGQTIVLKQQNDPFSTPEFVDVLDSIGAERYVVYGVVTEICVRCAAFGLLKRGGRIELVADAVQSLNREEAERMYADFQAGGGVLTVAAEVCA